MQFYDSPINLKKVPANIRQTLIAYYRRKTFRMKGKGRFHSPI